MSENNNPNEKKTNNRKKKKVYRFSIGKASKVFILTILIMIVLAGGVGAGMAISIINKAPEIDPSQVNASLDHTSYIYGPDGSLLEKIEAAEFRTYVSIDDMPQHLLDAFIAIEDERFYEHPGVDLRGIAASMLDNFKAGGVVRGASTITQQLAKNVYLSPEQKLSRKIQEAYLALQIDRVLHKDQILEAYLNRNFFGQNAYGVQEAAQTYFSKDVGQLTIAESALLAGSIKGNAYQPYIRVKPENYDENAHYKVGEADILGQKYILVFNETSVERQRLVLDKMFELGKISEAEYNLAKAVDIKTVLKPGQHKRTDITSYFTDFVKTQVIEALMDKLGYTKEQAEEMLFTGGLSIYSTIDVEMQKQLEEAYENFVEILVGNTSNRKNPVLIDWRLNKAGNIIDDKKNIVYYKQENLFDDDFNLVFTDGEYEVMDNGNLKIKSNKITIYPKHIDIADYYRIDDNKNLVSHTVGSIVIPEGEYRVGENKELIISKEYLDSNSSFYRIDEDGRLIVNNSYFFRDPDGIVQPQSASVIIDYKTGHIKALIGGRDVDGNRILNRATDSQRQPGFCN